MLDIWMDDIFLDLNINHAQTYACDCTRKNKDIEGLALGFFYSALVSWSVWEILECNTRTTFTTMSSLSLLICWLFPRPDRSLHGTGHTGRGRDDLDVSAAS